MQIRQEGLTAVNMGNSNIFNNNATWLISQMPEPLEVDPTQKAMFDQISISLQASAAQAKSQNPPLHGGYATYESINWDRITGSFSNALRIDHNNSVSGNYIYDFELSIEVLAAEYTLFYRDINSSSMSENDKSMAMERLNLVFDTAKRTIGDIFQKQLTDFLRKGSVDNRYNDISTAIYQIVDTRVEAYKSISDDFRNTTLGRRTGGLNSADVFVMMMYSDKNIETQTSGNNTNVIGKYTYEEIKAAFKATAKLNYQMSGFGDSGQVLYSQEETALIAGFAVMYYSMITNGIKSKSGLLADIEKSLFNQIKLGADKWGMQMHSRYGVNGGSASFSTDYVISISKQFNNLIFQQNFNANLLNLMITMRLNTQTHWWAEPFDSLSPKMINDWNEWIKGINSIDTSKYTIGFNKVA